MITLKVGAGSKGRMAPVFYVYLQRCCLVPLSYANVLCLSLGRPRDVVLPVRSHFIVIAICSFTTTLRQVSLPGKWVSTNGGHRFKVRGMV